MRSFQRNPPSVASYRGFTCWTRFSLDGETADQASFVSVVRTEPEKRLPPDFVIVLTTPPVNRPNSDETELTVVVVSWMASSMNRLFGVARTLSMMTAPSTVKRLSNVGPPEIVKALPRPVTCATPADAATAETIVRATGSLFVSSEVIVVEPCRLVETVSVLAVTVAAAVTPATTMLTSSVTCWAAVRATPVFVTVCKPWSVKVTV